MLTIAFKYVSTACFFKKNNLLVYYHSKRVLIATLSLYEMLNTRIFLNVHSICMFSEKKNQNKTCVKSSVYIFEILYLRIVESKITKKMKENVPKLLLCP